MRSPRSTPGVARLPLVLLLLLDLLVVGACQSHSAAWDDAWAQCQANSVEQMEFASPDPDQRSTWRERYAGACMQAKGFPDPQYLVK